MASNRKQPPASRESTPDASPNVEVIAKTHLGEEIGGVMLRFSPGDRFSTTARRAAALGPLVEVISGPVDPKS